MNEEYMTDEEYQEMLEYYNSNPYNSYNLEDEFKKELVIIREEDVEFNKFKNSLDNFKVEFPETQAGYQESPYGNTSRQRVNLYTEGKENQYQARGIRDNMDNIILQPLINDGMILRIEAYDPQIWPRVIEIWKESVINNYIKLDRNHTAEEMFEYLATFLSGTAKAMWEAYRKDYSQEYRDMMEIGPNVYNFVNKISMLLTSSDPNSGNLNRQREAMYTLEQLSIRDWKYIKPFLLDYVHNAAESGNTFNKELADRLFKKLPGALGRKIEQAWENQDLNFMQVDPHKSFRDNVIIRAYFVIQKLKEQCTQIEINSQLKGEYSFCNTIFTPQKYGSDYNKRSWREQIRPRIRGPKTYYGKNPRERYPTKNYSNYSKKSPKRYSLRKSEAKKPFLDDKKHVRKVKKENAYKQIKCFSCNNIGHFSTKCPYKTTYIANGDRNAILVDTINEDLLEIDETMSDSESIYSIIEEDLSEYFQEFLSINKIETSNNNFYKEFL